MNWDKEDKKDEIDKDQDYVSKDNPYEIPDMVEKYLKDFPMLTKEEIEKRINDCMETVGAPFPRDIVEKCVEKSLKLKLIMREIADKN